MNRKAAWCVVLLAVLLLTGCGADISAYGDRQIRVSGLLEEDFYVTPNELSRLNASRRRPPVQPQRLAP